MPDNESCGIGREARLHCLLDNELLVLAEVASSKLDVESEGITPKAIRNMLFSKTKCESDECMICKLLKLVKNTAYEPLVHRIKEIAFKAKGPGELNALLDNFLLIRMGKQMEANYTGIKFGGVLTYDFMIPPLLSRYGSPQLLVADWKRDQWEQFHMILNVDHRMGMGQHWVAMVISIPDNTIEYVDSYGQPPMSGLVHGSKVYPGITDKEGMFLSRLDEWIEEVRIGFISKGVAMKSVYGTMLHQERQDLSNCGVYATLYLKARAKRIPFDEFNSRPISMVQIRKQRSRLYTPTHDYQAIAPT